MDGYLVKPLTLASLLDTVTRVAARGRSAEEGARNVPRSIAVPDVPALSVEPPVVNSKAFDTTAGFMAPEAVASYMRTLADQAEALGHQLGGADALVVTDDIVAAAHALAGSASMFGFERLAAAGRDFEHAIQNGTAETPVLARSFSAALHSALEEMRSRMVVARAEP